MVLCLTHSQDHYTIDIVQQELQRQGISFMRLNTDEFATHYRLQYGIGGCCLQRDQQTIHSNAIRAVWYRKLWPMQPPENLAPEYRDLCLKEYQTYLQLFLHSLSVPWINHMDTDHFVSKNKLHQLHQAQAAGLIIPATLFTNDETAIRGFYQQHHGEVIMKLHNALSKTMEGNGAFFPTTRLEAAALDQLHLLTYCPMIFQAYIPKAYELRITYIEGVYFTGKITPEASGTVTDWRTLTPSHRPWEPYELPAMIKEKIHQLMQALGLSFGAIDMIRHTNGDYIFLEVNPQGEWGMLQKNLHYPIGETIAAKLINAIQHA